MGREIVLSPWVGPVPEQEAGHSQEWEELWGRSEARGGATAKGCAQPGEGQAAIPPGAPHGSTATHTDFSPVRSSLDSGPVGLTYCTSFLVDSDSSSDTQMLHWKRSHTLPSLHPSSPHPGSVFHQLSPTSLESPDIPSLMVFLPLVQL